MSKKVPAIACDQDIPYLSEWLVPACRLVKYQAGELSPDTLAGVDGLIVRSVTPVTADFLQASPCRWVGSVTAGINHLEISALQQAGIHWDHAPGGNAPAVCEYVLSALFLAHEQGRLNKAAVIGVIGIGEVGSRVVQACQEQGFQVLSYDPPRAEREPLFSSVDWGALSACEFIVVCASYTQSGKWPSHQLIDAAALSQWTKLGGLINAARGEIVDYAALLATPLWTCLDVWPNEPTINSDWVARANLATPHIAGYSKESKWRLSAMIYQACCAFFQLDSQLVDQPSPAPVLSFRDTVGLELLSEQVKAAMAKDSSSASFHALRRNYPLRSESSFTE